MADTTRETTTPRHYRGAADAGAPRLAGLPGVHRADPEPQTVSEVERYDTDDHRLAAARITVAVHRDGPDAHWLVDLPDGDRTERLRIPGTADPASVPGAIDELARGVTRGRTIAPVGRVRTVRVSTPLFTHDDRLLARVTHDEVSLATFGDSTELRSWTEATFELLDAAPGLAQEVERRFADSGLAPSAPAADAELQALLRPRNRRVPGGKKGSAGAVLVAYLAAQVDRLAAEDLRVRRDEPDSVHQLRVASRRLRSALQAYRPLLDRRRTDPLVDALRGFGQALAPARDAEVLAERISTQLAELPDELRLGRVQALATRHFARTEQETRAAVLTTLDGEPYAALRASLERLLEDPPLRRTASGKASTVLTASVGRTARRLQDAMRTAIDESVPTAERDEAVHSARKAGKRLRYATEVARPALGKPAKRFAKQLKGLQTALGEHQDTVVSRDALRSLGAAAHADGENGFSFGVLHARDEARAAQIERDLPALFRQAWDRNARRWAR